MVVLKICKKIVIVADEADVKANNVDNLKIIFQNRTYEADTWKCISDPSQRLLYPELREEFFENLDDALSEFALQHELTKPVFVEVEKEVEVQKPETAALEKLLVDTMAKYSVDEVVKLAQPMLEKHIKETFGILPQIHEVRTPQETHKIEGVVHERFDDVLNLVNLDIPVFLTGQAGTGKNVMCKQIAESLGLDFYFTNAVTQEYQLKGFIDANGTYHETQFYKAFTEGGLFFLDEMDGSIPETLIILNSAIANRYFDFPTGRVEAHPDFRVIGAGNTTGMGADIEYTGRYQLDASSLDRFAMVEIGYSKNIDEAVSGGNKPLCEFAEEFRRATKAVGLRCLCTYRAVERIAKLEGVFDDLKEVLNVALIKGLRIDDIKILNNEIKLRNKYTKALYEMAR